MSKARAIRAALRRLLGETARDAGVGAAGYGGASAIMKGNLDDVVEDAKRGAATGAVAGRALRTAFRRTGNAGAQSSVRRSGRGLMPKGGSRRMAKAADARAKETDDIIRHNQRHIRSTQYTSDKAAERDLRNNERLFGRAAQERNMARKLRTRQAREEGLSPSERKRAFRQFGKAKRTGNAGPQSSVKSRRETEFNVRSKAGGDPVEARRATTEGTVTTGGGATLKYKPGDMIVTYGPGDQAVVRGDIFADTYRKLSDGRYVKREGVRMRAAVAKRARNVRTLEGPARAERGDVIMRGTRGERWPVQSDKFHRKYDVEF